jgi:hypothetical protein
MKGDIANTMTRVTQLQQATDALQRELDSQLQPLANTALQGIETLGNSIVTLYQAPDKSVDATSKQVATCKGQSKIVAERFNVLHAKAADILKKAGDVRTALVYRSGLTTEYYFPELHRGDERSDQRGQQDEAHR